MSQEDDSCTILAMERAALDRWGKGDPDGFLEICDDEVVYFDPFQPGRVDGLAALRELYEGLRGKIGIEAYDIVEPKVEVMGDAALLTFRFNSRGNENQMRWNTTELYRRAPQGWRIVHSHWSFTQPELATKR